MSLPAQSLSYLIGIVSLSVWSILAARNGHLVRKKPQLHADLAKGPNRLPILTFLKRHTNNGTAQHYLWSLDHNNSRDRHFEHNFIRTREDVQLHYLSSSGSTASKTLIIFLHGFPDSCHIFAHFLSSPLADHAKIVSLDLPGFGGSDGLPHYSAEEVLNTLVKAIVLLKQRYVRQMDDHGPAQTILVGHDWGGVISSRLAMETQGLVDRVVIINAPVPQLFSLNLQSGITACRHSLKAWWQHKTKTQALVEAREAIRPVLAQLIKSNYVFMFLLSFFRTRVFGFVIEYLISLCHRAAAKEQAASWAAWSWASSAGPSVSECTTTSEGGLAYSGRVRQRAMKYPYGDWDTRVRLYGEGLLTGSWVLRHETDDNRNVRQVQDGGDHGFQCPSSIIFGLRDPALDYRICVKDVEIFFTHAKGRKDAASHITLIDDCGHWSPLEKTGTHVVRELLMELTGAVGTPFVTETAQSTVRRSDFS